jgi:hypothetical protein
MQRNEDPCNPWGSSRFRAEAPVRLASGCRPPHGGVEVGSRSYGYSRLETALGWLRSGDVAEAQREVAEALEFLRTDTSRLIIAEDTAAHDDAIRVLEGIGWD